MYVPALVPALVLPGSFGSFELRGHDVKHRVGVEALAAPHFIKARSPTRSASSDAVCMSVSLSLFNLTTTQKRSAMH